MRDLDHVDVRQPGGDQRLFSLCFEVTGEQHRASREPHGDDQRVVVDAAHGIGGELDRRIGRGLVARRPGHQLGGAGEAREPERRVHDPRAAGGEPPGDRGERGMVTGIAGARDHGFRFGSQPQLVDRDIDREQAEVVIGVRVRDDRDVDVIVTVRREHAFDRATGTGRDLESARIRTSTGIDQPDVAGWHLDDRGIALTDVDERHPQRAVGWGRATQ